MKMETRLTYTAKQKIILSQQQQHSLHILSLNEQQMETELQSVLAENPLLEWDESLYIQKHDDIFEQVSLTFTKHQSLYEVLEEQLRLCPYSLPVDLTHFLMDELDNDGFLRLNSEELTKLFPYELDLIEETIAVLQTFEPCGIFAHNLQECILIQLTNRVPYPKLAIQLANDYFEEIATKKWLYICKSLNIDETQLKEAVKQITSTNPRPASAYKMDTSTILPEAKIEVKDNEITICFMRKYQSLRINTRYDQGSLCFDPYFKQQKHAAQCFISDIQKRYATLQAILSLLCEKQKNYFLYKQELIPLTQKEIANELHLHESTVSRAISQKVIEYENRYIPITSLFPKALNNGQSNSSTMNKIRQIIKQENEKKPYSDQSIVNLLSDEGIQISRRTVTKYREQMHVPSAQQRKQL